MSAAPGASPTTPNSQSAVAETEEYTGGCHCQRFRFKFSHTAIENGQTRVMSCNCSICNQHGLLHIYVPEQHFKFTVGEPEQLASYQLHGKLTTHHFCMNCGSNIIVRNEEAGEVVVNVRAVDGIDVSKLNLINFDGRNKL